MRYLSCWCLEKEKDPRTEALLGKSSRVETITSSNWDSASSKKDKVSSMIVRPSIRDWEAEKAWPAEKELGPLGSSKKRVDWQSTSSAERRSKSKGIEIPSRLSLEITTEDTPHASSVKYLTPGKFPMSSPNLTAKYRKFSSLAFPLTGRSVTDGTIRTVTLTSSSYQPYPMTEILPRLYLGNIDDAWNADELKAKEITHILSVTQSRSKVAFVKHEHIPMHDKGLSNLERVLEKAIPFIEEGQEGKNTVLVHCMLGQNRSATVVIAYLMKNHEKNLYRSHKYVKALRGLIQINRGYAEKLLKLEKEIYGKNTLPQDWMEKESVNMTTSDVKFKWENVSSTVHRQLYDENEL